MLDPQGGLLFEPRNTVVTRDGRALDGTNAMRSLPFPWPSTIAGCTRSALGALGGGDDWRPNLKVETAGPWLARLGPQGVSTLLLPAPADCVWRALGEGGLKRWRLRPGIAGAATTNLPDNLSLVMPDGDNEQMSSAKAPNTCPRWWVTQAIEDWLRAPKSNETVANWQEAVGPSEPIQIEQRTHVRVDPGPRTAADGDLFTTEGARYATVTNARYALAAWVDPAHRAAAVAKRLVKLGGEGRLSRISRSDAAVPAFERVRPALVGATRVRVMLVTPGVFSGGALPDPGRITQLFGPNAKVMAACVGRPDVISGWDMAARAPRATRRMAKAGAVYWVDGVDPARLEAAWMSSLCDAPQDQLDGFGRMILGVA